MKRRHDASLAYEHGWSHALSQQWQWQGVVNLLDALQVEPNVGFSVLENQLSDNFICSIINISVYGCTIYSGPHSFGLGKLITAKNLP